MKVRFFLWLIFIALNLDSFAQQVPHFSQWYLNQLIFNPAHSGIKQCAEVNAVHRAQWVGIDGAPKSTYITFSAPINVQRKKVYQIRHGLGMHFENDEIGPFVANRFMLNYAAHMNFDQYRRLSIGISGGVQQWTFNKNKVNTVLPDNTIQQFGSFIKPNASVGVWWNSVNYYVGASVNQLAKNVWDNISGESQFGFHTYLNGGYRKTIKETITFLPVALIRIPPKGPWTGEVILNTDWNNQFTIGIGYRTSSAFLFSAQFKMFNYVNIVYNFDFGTNALSMPNQQTHEIGLYFSTCKSKDNQTNTSCPLF